MFAILLVPNEHTEQEVFGVLSFIAALFFVVIVAHIGLRGDITAEGVTYIEYFYIVMYVAMLVVSGLSIFFSSRIGFHLIQYRDNLISKLLYWPVILGTSLGITLLIL
jgi:hypothetical protein